MVAEWIIYHNTRCSKSRETLALLYEHNITASVIDYLRTPPTESQLREILKKLKVSAKDLLRTKEPIFSTLHLNLKDEEEVIRAMVMHPILMERPIVVYGKKAVIGRPPEKILELVHEYEKQK